MDKANNKRTGSFLQQAMILAAASLITKVIGFVYLLPLTNMIGDTGNAIYGKAYTIYNFFLVLSSAGMPAAISKLVSERVTLGRRDEAHRVFRTALILSGAFGAICMAVLLFGAGALSGLMDSPRSYYSMLSLAPTVFIVAIMAVFRGYFQGLGTTVPTSISQVVEQIFNAVSSLVLAGAFMGLATNDPVAMGAAGGTAGTGVGAAFGLLTILIYYLMSKRNITDSVKTTEQDTGRKKERGLASVILRTSVPIIAGTAVFSFSTLIDSSMVTRRLMAGGFTVEQAEVLFGQLSGKYTHIVTLPISIATVLATAVIPSISSSKALNDQTAVESKINTALRMAMLVCVPAAAGLAVLGVPIIKLLFQNFNEGGILLQIGAINIIFMALNQILTGPLQATGNVHIPVIAAASGSLVKILANWILVPIPEINIVGAVLSSSLCYITASSINWYFLKKKTGARIAFVKLMQKPVLCSALMAVVCYAAYNAAQYVGLHGSLSTVAAVLMGVLVYFILMLVMRGFDKGDLRMLPFGGKLVTLLERRSWI